MGNIFTIIIVQPLLNVLFFVYSILPGHDFGIAVILVTILVRLILWPLASKQLHSQKKLTAIQPEVKKIQDKYKKDPAKMNAAVMELYKEKEVNPFSSCLPTLLQLPILLGFFYVFKMFSDPNFVMMTQDGILKYIYPFIQNFGPVKEFIAVTPKVNTMFLGIIDLAQPKNIFLAVSAGVLQFIQSKMMLPKKQAEKDTASAVTTQMTYIFPLLSVYIGYILPAALPLYWATMTLVAIGQQYLVMRKDVEKLEEDKFERRSNKKSK